jgi:hypothetical protein
MSNPRPAVGLALVRVQDIHFLLAATAFDARGSGLIVECKYADIVQVPR